MIGAVADGAEKGDVARAWKESVMLNRGQRPSHTLVRLKCIKLRGQWTCSPDAICVNETCLMLCGCRATLSPSA